MPKAPYNYAEFTPLSYGFTAQAGLKVGDKLPSFSLTDLDGKTINLNRYAGKLLVLETGSITCPLYVGKIKSMNALAQDYPDVQFLVVYIREAHPGKKITSHDSVDAKRQDANNLKRKEPENRTILIDGLEGGLHEKLGLLPNMAYVIDKDSTVLFRADWNIPDRIKEVLDAIIAGAPIPTEPADFTPVSPHYSLRVLARAGGIKAVWEFLTHLPALMKQHKAHWENRKRQ